MKTLFPFSSIVAAVLSIGAVVASAQSSGFYATGDLGGTLTQDANFNSVTPFDRNGPTPPEIGKVKFDPGVRLGIAGGYHVTDWLGVEGVSGIMSSRLDSMSFATTHDTFFNNVPLMAGIRLEWPHQLRISPYVGASAGGALSVLDADRLTVNGSVVHGTQSEVVFAYQAFGGVRYAINEHMGVGIEYHFFSTQATEWRDNGNFDPSNRFRIGGAIVNSVSVAFQYKF